MKSAHTNTPKYGQRSSRPPRAPAAPGARSDIVARITIGTRTRGQPMRQAPRWTIAALFSVALAAASAQTPGTPNTPAQTPAARPTPPKLRSRISVYDLRDHSVRVLYTADSTWKPPTGPPTANISSPTPEACSTATSSSPTAPSPAQDRHRPHPHLQQRQNPLARRQAPRLLRHRQGHHRFAGLPRQQRRQ